MRRVHNSRQSMRFWIERSRYLLVLFVTMLVYQSDSRNRWIWLFQPISRVSRTCRGNQRKELRICSENIWICRIHFERKWFLVVFTINHNSTQGQPINSWTATVCCCRISLWYNFRKDGWGNRHEEGFVKGHKGCRVLIVKWWIERFKARYCG